MSDDEMADSLAEYRPHNLPEGIQKQVIKEADESAWRRPSKGDDLTVHYVGTLEDGTKFDSSRDRGEPIDFPLGEGKVIKGWEEGIATMRKGEIAKFTFQPQWAYGEKGNPPTIPENAVLIFEVELIKWIAKDELFDGAVIKSVVKEGEGWDTPKNGEEVRCTMRVLCESGDVIEEKKGYETIMGSCTLEPPDLAKVVDKVLSGMKLEEKVSLALKKDYIFKDKDKVTIELVLEAMYETTDVSFLTDKSIIKKRVDGTEGEYSKPGDDVKVSLRVEAITDGASPLKGFKGPKEISFKTGAGQACDALEAAVVDMKKGEKALVTCTAPIKCRDELTGLVSELTVDKVVFTLELLDFDKDKELHSMGGEEKLILGMLRKEKGGELFKRKRFELALSKYKKVIELMNNTDHMSKECKLRAAELKHIAEMNKAACYLQLGEATLALATCNTILQGDRNNSKALLRRAKAHFMRHEHVDALRDLERVLELDPENSEAKALIPQVKRGQKVLDKESANAYKTMFQNLDKVGFGKENKKPAPKPKKEEPDEQPQDQVAVTFKLEHKIEPGEQLWVTGSPEVMGAWDITKGLQMKRVPGPPDYEAMALGKPPKEQHLWEATILVPEEEGRTEYHYVVRASSGDRVEAAKHIAQLGGSGGSRCRCSDRWRAEPIWEPPSEE